MVRVLLVLGRVSNLPTVWTNCVAGWFLAGGDWDAGLALLAGGGSLLYAGGMFLNDACDAAFDREHCPERPIPSGAISRRAVAVLAGVLLGAGYAMVVWRFPLMETWLTVTGLLAAIVVYDVVHKRWPGAVVMMGICRGLLYVIAGGAAMVATERDAPAFWVWPAAGAMFLYIVGVTLAARGERTGGEMRKWAWVLFVAPVVVGVILSPMAAGLFSVIFAGWLWWSHRMLRGGEENERVPRFVGALLAGIVLADAVMVSAAGWMPAVVCAAFLPLVLFLQKYVPAT